jgi:hypothetical protein
MIRGIQAVARSETSSSKNLHEFTALSRKLRESEALDLNKPLSYWVRKEEASLGQSLLSRSLDEIFRCSYEELYSIRGVGVKKVDKLLSLLKRLSQDPNSHRVTYQAKSTKETQLFQAAYISEHEWAGLREKISKSYMANEPLGRLASGLKYVPTVIWNTPLKQYCQSTMSEMRTQKTHGTKRIAAVVNAFRSASEILSNSQTRAQHPPRLPLFANIEQWYSRSPVERRHELRELAAFLINPIMQQFQADLPELTLQVVHERLGWECQARSVIQISKKHRLTRARVYQHLDIPVQVLKLRWPDGKELWKKCITELTKLDKGIESHETFILLKAIYDLFFYW